MPTQREICVKELDQSVLEDNLKYKIEKNSARHPEQITK